MLFFRKLCQNHMLVPPGGLAPFLRRILDLPQPYIALPFWLFVIFAQKGQNGMSLIFSRQLRKISNYDASRADWVLLRNQTLLISQNFLCEGVTFAFYFRFGRYDRYQGRYQGHKIGLFGWEYNALNMLPSTIKLPKVPFFVLYSLLCNENKDGVSFIVLCWHRHV